MELSAHIFLQCESLKDLVIEGYEYIKLLHLMGEWPESLDVTIWTEGLNTNVNTSFSNS